MKVLVKRAQRVFFFCHQKGNKKADRLCMKQYSYRVSTIYNSSYNSQWKCVAGAAIPYFEISAPLFCCPLKEYLNLQIRINKMVKPPIFESSFSVSRNILFGYPGKITICHANSLIKSTVGKVGLRKFIIIQTSIAFRVFV